MDNYNSEVRLIRFIEEHRELVPKYDQKIGPNDPKIKSIILNLLKQIDKSNMNDSESAARLVRYVMYTCRVQKRRGLATMRLSFYEFMGEEDLKNILNFYNGENDESLKKAADAVGWYEFYLKKWCLQEFNTFTKIMYYIHLQGYFFPAMLGFTNIFSTDFWKASIIVFIIAISVHIYNFHCF